MGSGSVATQGTTPMPPLAGVVTLPLAAVPFDSPWPVVCVAGAVAALSFLLWSQAGQRPFLVATILALAIAAGAIVADRVVVTERERLESMFQGLAVAAEQADADTILAAFDPAVDVPREEARRALRDFHPEEVRITRFDVVTSGPPADRRARVEILVRVRGALGNAAPAAALIDLVVLLRGADGRFLITDFEERAGNPTGRR